VRKDEKGEWYWILVSERNEVLVTGAHRFVNSDDCFNEIRNLFPNTLYGIWIDGFFVSA